GAGHVLDVLHVLPAAVADVVRAPQGERLDGLGRLAGHAEVAAHAVDGPGAQADAGQAVVLEVDAGVALVAALEVAVVRGGARGRPAGGGGSRRAGRTPRPNWRRPGAAPARRRAAPPRRPRACPGR